MAKPPYSEDAFLNAVFHPRKHAIPGGIHKSHIKVTKGRRVARVNAWNKLPGWKQKVISSAGMQEEYLRGQATYTDAKRRLRGRAINRGITGTTRQRVVKHLVQIVSQRPYFNEDGIETRVGQMSPHQLALADAIDDFDDYLDEMAGDEFWDEDEGVNLLWYK